MSERRAEQGFRGLIGEPWMLSRMQKNTTAGSLRAQWDRKEERRDEGAAEVQAEISFECAVWPQGH